MKCGRIISYLNTYADGELTEKQRLVVKNHLATCETCRRRLEEIRSLEIILRDSLPVPPEPDGLAARIMAEARKRQPASGPFKRRFPPPVWNPLQWVAGLSAPMRIAACATALLALTAGLSLNGGQISGRNVNIETEKNLYGLEWFGPAPAGSIGSVYIAMADEDYGKRIKQ